MTFKKTRLIQIALVFVLLAGCSSSPAGTASTPSAPIASTNAATTPPAAPQLSATANHVPVTDTPVDKPGALPEITPSVAYTPTAAVSPSPSPEPPIRLALIGDYGLAGQPELDVANLVLGWEPDYILTTGDNNYPNGEQETIDANIGQYYHAYIAPYTGAYGEGAAENRYYPVLGNHDWNTPNAQPYLDYFTLPGNERYYDVVLGPVHLFMLDSDSREPDGVGRSTAQATWLQQALAASTSPWKLVIMHHAPYSSGQHGGTDWIQWPFAEWGADAVLAGHDHVYERLQVDGIPYFVNGVGGGPIYAFILTDPASQFRYNDDYGAMLITADDGQITFSFSNRQGELIDTYSLNH
jgi:tartrate-resistant acid phosphatase type 5